MEWSGLAGRGEAPLVRAVLGGAWFGSAVLIKASIQAIIDLINV